MSASPNEIALRRWMRERGWSTTTVAELVLLAGLFVALYARTITGLAGKWWNHDQLHGFLVPLISLYLVWMVRERLRHVPTSPVAALGLPIILVAGSLVVLGEIGGVATLSEISLLGMIVGLVLLLGGTAYLRVLGFPITYLAFMLPILEDLVAPLHWPLQLITAQQGVTILQMLGFPALVEQQYVVLPHITLEVAGVCSGVNYLISIAAIGLPLAYLALRKLWSRVALILLAVAIGWMANWLRVVLIGVWTSWGGEGLHGPFHILQGMFVAWVGYVGLFVAAWGLAKSESWGPDRGRAINPAGMAKALSSQSFPVGGRSLHELTLNDLPTDPPVSVHAEPSSPRAWHRAWWLAMLSLAGFLVIVFLTDRGPVNLKRDFAQFPRSIGDWVGTEADLQTAVFRIEGADQELLRNYRNHRGRRVQLYVAYLTSQRQGKEIINYVTARLHEQANDVTIPVDSGRVVKANRGRLGDRANERRTLFWYDVSSQIHASRYRAKLATLWDGLRRGRTNGAFVLLAGNPFDGDTVVLEREEEAFARVLIPILQQHIP